MGTEALQNTMRFIFYGIKAQVGHRSYVKLCFFDVFLFDGIGDLHKYAYARTSIEMDGTLNFDWSHLGGRILA